MKAGGLSPHRRGRRPIHAIPIRRRGLLAILLLPALALPAALLAGEGGELLCAPSRVGCITTWLVAGPMRILRPEAFDADLLEAAGGEAKARPRDGDTADAANGLAWQAAVHPESVLNFRSRCLPLGESAFYLSAWLLPRRDVRCTLELTHTGTARAWVDGTRVIASKRDAMTVGGKTATHELALRKDRRVHCLFKLASESRQLQFVVRLARGQDALGPDDVVVVLPTRQAEMPTDPFVLSALRLSSGREDFVEGGKPAAVFVGISGGYPVARGKVSGAVVIKNDKGRKVETLKVEPTSVPALSERSARLTWTPPATGGSPYYELTAELTLDGRRLGVLSHTVYSPRDIGQWWRSLQARLGDLSKQGKVTPDTLALVLLKLDKAATLIRSTESFARSPGDIHLELKGASDLLDRVAKGKGLPPLEPGVREFAYLAEQDESTQPYYLHVPRTYTATKAMPAIVYLHGYAPWLDKTNWHDLSYGLTDLAEEHGYVIICPFARSNTDFQGVGEADVLTVLRLAQKRVKIDPDRIFLLGYSMGGMGAYTIAAHTPDLWAGALVMCGRADYWLWKDIDPAKVEPWKRHLIDLEFGWPLAANFRHVPVIAYQGTDDMLIKPTQAYRFVDRLKANGCDATLVRHEGSSHWIADETFSTPKPFEWMKRRRRVATPSTVSFKTYTLLYNTAWWATIDAIDTWGTPAQVTATLQPGNRLTVTTTNVARLTLRPPRQIANPAAPFKTTLNGKATALKAKDGEIVLNLATQPTGKLRKTPTLCGPIKDALNRRFLFVYGTTGGDEATKQNRAAARTMQKDWYLFAKGFRRVAKDTEATPAEMAKSHLFLFGTPKTHAILAKIADKLPIKFRDDGYEVLGRPFRGGPRVGLQFIYPNPLAPERYVVVCSGHPYGATLPPNHKYDLLPDFIIYRGVQTAAFPAEPGPGGPDYDDTNPSYCAGFFNSAWQLEADLIWIHDGSARPKPGTEPPPKPRPAPKPKPTTVAP